MMFGHYPNITGTHPADLPIASTGVFKNTTTVVQYASGDGNGNVLDFSASRVSAVYGKSSVVQPPAFQALIIIKV